MEAEKKSQQEQRATMGKQGKHVFSMLKQSTMYLLCIDLGCVHAISSVNLSTKGELNNVRRKILITFFAILSRFFCQRAVKRSTIICLARLDGLVWQISRVLT